MSEGEFWEKEVDSSLDRIRRQTGDRDPVFQGTIASIPGSRGRGNWKMPPPILLRVAALLVVAIGLVFLLLPQTGHSGMDATAFVKSHKRTSESASHYPELVTDDLGEVKVWLAEHLPSVSCPSGAPTGYRLGGARIVRIEEDLAGVLVYEKEGQKISCFLQSGLKNVDHGFEQVERRADGIQMGRCRDFQVVTWAGVAGSGVVVGDLSESGLLAFAEQSSRSLLP